MFEPIPGYDAWKLASPPDVEYDPQPNDPCVCGHVCSDHRGHAEVCWECPKVDQACDGFKPNWKKIDAVEPPEED